MKKTLYLHIGRPKVGSTALQHFLFQNREELNRQGILYPHSALHQRASHKLALVFQPNLPGHKHVHGQSPAQIYGALADEAAQSGCSRVVASSENLFLVEPDAVKSALGAAFTTKIICYVRRQDEVLTSSFLQELKAGAVDIDTNIEAYANDPERLKWLDYSQVLNQWARAFGRDNIIVRVFEPAQMNGSIFADLTSILGADIESMRLPPKRVNPSPARDVLDFIRIINDGPVGGPGLKQIFREPLLSVSEHLGIDGPWDPKALVPLAVKRQILERFAESNAELARNFLGRRNGVLFQEMDVAETDDFETYSGFDLERFANMAASIFCFQQQQIQQLKQQLDQLTKQGQKAQ